MKTIALLLLLVALHLDVAAQYQLNWSTLDAGGGQCAGGPYTVQGTLGQPDAATSAGGAYTLYGGFWSALAIVPTEGAPALGIIPSGTNVILAWPNPSTGFQLQETAGLSAPNWTDVNSIPAVVAGEKQVTQPIALGSRFYRLRKP
jgi:hypothetical protein